MTKKSPSEELSWEEAVSRYLEDNPEYFRHRPEVLAAIDVPHLGRGKTPSLIERQVQVLRHKNLAVEQQLRELLAMARENDVLGERLHRFAISMIDAASLDDVLDTAKDMLRQEFRLDAVVVLLQAQSGGESGRPELVDTAHPTFTAVLRQCTGKKPICGGKYTDEIMSYLFSGLTPEIKSTALVGLADSARNGVLVLGSRDPHRFHPEMGTLYLTRLGELLMRAAARYLPAAA